MPRLPNSCPQCHSDMRGQPIPDRHAHLYPDHATHYLRWVAVYSVHADRTEEYRCPSCSVRFDREVLGAVA